MKIVVALGILILVLLSATPIALASGNNQSRVFSRTVDVNGLTIVMGASYMSDWNWTSENRVVVTISRVDGPSNASLVMIDESAVLHENGSNSLLARSQVIPDLPGYSRIELAKPFVLSFSFTNESYTANAQQGNEYSAHLAVAVDMLVISNNTSTTLYFSNGPRDILITLSTEGPGARPQTDSILYLVASEVIGFAGIVFLMKSVKVGDGHKTS